MKCIIALLFTSAISAQTAYAASYEANGVVSNSDGEIQEFATYRIFNITDTVKPVAYGVTDGSGLFAAKLEKPGDYKVTVSVVGLADESARFTVDDSTPVINLGILRCGNASNVLGEVTVTATRPLVVKEIDRIGYDVKADVEAPTSNLQEILRKVPLVSVEPDGTIKVMGSSDFKIYKNGRPNNSFTKNAKDIFKAIPASMIKKIEVITDPGAREDAEGVGAILNIVTEQGSSIKGTMANVSLNYDAIRNTVSPNLWGSAQIDKVTLSAYAGLNLLNRRTSTSESYTEGHYAETGNISRQGSKSKSKGNVNWWGIDGSFELDSLNLFTLEFGGYSYSVRENATGWYGLEDATGNTIYSYITNSRTKPSSYLDFNGNFNYQHSTHRKGENLTFSYMISTTKQKSAKSTVYQDAWNMPVDYSGIESDYRLNFMEHTFQFNWTRPIAGIHVVDMGLKYVFRDNNSKTNQEYVGTDRHPVTDFTHHTHVAAAFADYRVRVRRFNFRAGLRYEFSRLSASYADGSQPDFGSNLSDLVPNLAVSYSINDANTLKLAYGTRINRPGISYLNPAVTESPDATSQGNPDLGSSRYNNINLNYSLISRKVTLDMSIGYNFTDNGITSVVDVIGNHTYSGFANAGKDKVFNASAFLQWMVGLKTTFMLNANSSYNRFSNPSLNISKSGWSGFAYMRLTQKLPWKLTGTVGVSYWAGSTSLYNVMRPVNLGAMDYNLSLTRNFLKEDRLSVRVMVRNPFYPGRVRYRSESFNTSYKTLGYTYQRYSQSFGVGISYRFGQMSASVKKTATSISNDDLVGRKKE